MRVTLELQKQTASDDLTSSGLLARIDGVNAGRLSHFGFYYGGSGSSRNIDDERGGAAGLYASGNPGTFPPGGTFWWITTQRTYTGETRFQLAYSYSSTGTPSGADTTTWYRTCSGTGVWGPWVRLLTNAGIVGTVAQSGGVPTGAIIERGSNANGEYVKFADGTMICTLSRSDTLNSAPIGQVHRSAVPAWNFPASFAVAPIVTINISGPTTWGNPGSVNTTSMLEGFIWSAGALASSGTCRLLAIGRWF